MTHRDDVRVVKDFTMGCYNLSYEVDEIQAGKTSNPATTEVRVVNWVLVTWRRKRRLTVRTQEASPPMQCAPFCFMEK